MRSLFCLLLLTLTTTCIAQSIKDCSVCTSQVLQQDQLIDLSSDQIRFLTNDLYARKGYNFSNPDIQEYYHSTNWYSPVGDNTQIIYSDIETQNIKILQERQSQLKKDRENLLRALSELKTNILSNKLDLPLGDMQSKKYMFQTLKQLDMQGINWNKHQGLYAVEVDNGDFVIVYKITIDKNLVTISYALQGLSAFNEPLYPVAYTMEFTYFWNFIYQDNELKFDRFDIVG